MSVDEWPEETIWLQMNSVGAAAADRLVEVATAHGVTLFDAPVSGSTHPAEEGQLTNPRLGARLGSRAGRTGLRRARLEGPVGGWSRDGLAPEAGGQTIG
jgi:hypothetical protein